MLVRFAAYREYQAARSEANDAMMALLIASKLGSHQLAGSLAQPDTRLTTLYAALPGIRRLDVSVARASDLMRDAERHLAFMAIPFVLAVHESLLLSTVALLRQEGIDYQSSHWQYAYAKDIGRIGLARLHQYIAERVAMNFDPAHLALFLFANRVRNRLIHHRGVPTPSLMSDYSKGLGGHRSLWEGLTHRSLTVRRDTTLELGEGELIAALALTGRLAIELNESLQPPTLDESVWARLAVEDYRASYPERFVKPQYVRRVLGFARALYTPIALDESDIRTALSTLGY
jgi:hypothetical protein